jgi:hypothetical protein
MRSPAVAVLFLSLCAAAHAADVHFKRVWPQWHDADGFQSYYEDHTGKELTGKWTIFRSNSKERGGLYFLTRVENPGASLKGATFVVRVISPESQNTRVFNFPADVPVGSTLFQIGLTGKDWAGPRVEPVAWDVELQAADGHLICQTVSYLWEKPER